MRVLILEDERPARELLVEAVRAWPSAVEVVGELGSVADALAWLARNPAPDLILSDIQLSDGLALEVFDHTDRAVPVVFVTAYDAYVMDAFEAGGIDYVLKPIEVARVHEALARYQRLQAHFTGRLDVLAEALRPRRRRLLVRRGVDVVAVGVDRVAWCTTEDKVTFVVDRDGQRWRHDATLSQLENELDPAAFFRLNRQFLAHVDAVDRYRSLGRGRLEVVLSPRSEEPVQISQETAARFRAWLDA